MEYLLIYCLLVISSPFSTWSLMMGWTLQAFLLYSKHDTMFCQQRALEGHRKRKGLLLLVPVCWVWLFLALAACLVSSVFLWGHPVLHNPSMTSVPQPRAGNHLFMVLLTQIPFVHAHNGIPSPCVHPHDSLYPRELFPACPTLQISQSLRSKLLCLPVNLTISSLTRSKPQLRGGPPCQAYPSFQYFFYIFFSHSLIIA